MKRRIFGTLLLLFSICYSGSYTKAQVTIGSATPPASGALLDLKEYDDSNAKTGGRSADRGLGLPRVKLLSISGDLATSLDADATAGSLNSDDHVGLIVYNVSNVAPLCPGLYVWDGDAWQIVGDEAMPKILKAEDVSVVRVGTASVSGTLTVVASQGAEVEWYDAPTGGTLLHTGNSYTTPALAASTTYFVAATNNGCTTARQSITLNLLTVDATGNYLLTGKTCYDVNQTSSTECGPTSERKDDFETTKTFVYTFKGTKAFTDLKFSISDPGNTIVSHSMALGTDDDATLTITFRDDINSYIVKEGTQVINIVATYKDNTNKLLAVELEAKVQDCSCCGAYIDANTWKVFKCHNLGANESLDPFTPSKGIIGNYYQWGRNVGVADADTPEGAISGWKGYDDAAPDGAWGATKTINDPCPDGFRVPTEAEWRAIIAEPKNVQRAVGTSWNADKDNFTTGRFLGPRLFMPAMGYRSHEDGELFNRGRTSGYWSSIHTWNRTAFYLTTTSSTFAVLYNERAIGHGVRCIAE